MSSKFSYLMMAASVLFATSCESDEELVSVQQAATSTVSFNLSTPQMASRAYSDGLTATHLQYAVYDNNGTLLSDLTNNQATINGSTTVDLQLVTGNTYSVVFWAAAPNAPYTVDFENKSVAISYDNAKSNDEARDAFYAYKTFTVEGAQSERIELKRPFAQINIGTSDYAAAQSAGYVPTQSSVEVTGVANKLNFVDGTVEGDVTATFALADINKDEAFPVADNKYLAMNYVLVGADKQLVDVAFTYTDNNLPDKERVVSSVPVQRNYRTNIYGKLLTSEVDINVEIKPEYNEPGYMLEYKPIAYAQDLAAALTADQENIAVALTSDIELPISSLGQMTGGSGEYKLGGDNTKNISIDLNGHTLKFTTTYWSVIGAKNADATFTIKNGTVTSSQATGTWNSYDMGFANCNYVIEDVTFEKAVAFENEGKAVTLKNVTINEIHDYYAMWITAEGQTVNIDGLTINSAGRGIKIDEQYVDAPAKVTLNIEGANFTTAKKAAIMVKSAAGAEINWGKDNNISNVKEDFGFAVWVDEDAAAHADKVVVNGALVKVEGSKDIIFANSSETMATALQEGATTVYLTAGDYVLPHAAKGKTLTIKGTDNPQDVKVAVTKVGNGGENCDYALDGSTVLFENITITTNSSTYIGYARCKGTYNNCVINGTYTLYGDSKFNGCTFNVSGDVYNLWTWGAPNAEFNNCTFNSDGKALLLYGQANTNLTVNDCTFNDKGGLADMKAAIEIGNDYGTSYNVVVNNTTVNGYEINDKGIDTGSTLWGNKNSMGTDKLNVVVDGVDVY